MDLFKLVNEANTIAIAGHVRPDGDCVGSCLALYLYLSKYLPQAQVQVFLEEPADIFKEIKGFDTIDSSFSKQEQFDVYFALDCGADRLGGAEGYFATAVKKINIDHHISNPGCGDVSVVRANIGSTCEVLYDLMDEDVLDRDIAMALYIGMVHDTGVFQYSNTTPDTLTAAAHLISFGFDFPRMIEETFYQKSLLQTRIMGKVLLESTLYMDGHCIVGVVDQKTMEEYGVNAKDLDGIVNQLRNIKGVNCAVFAYEIEQDEFKFSMRSDEKVDASKVAGVFGGGGHVRAAGCTLKGSLQECLDKVLPVISEQLQSN